MTTLEDGRPRIVELAPGERSQRTVIHASVDGRISFGNAAFRAYLEQDLTGRFLRSIKAFLPQDVPGTQLGSRRYAFPELVTAYVRFLVDGAQRVLGREVVSLVVGRPVEFHADPVKHARAVERLEEAIRAAGVASWSFQLEPVAAARLHELSLTDERVVLVGDFGGGTADFAVFRAGPGRAGDRRSDVLGVSGVAAAGDALDGRFVDTFLLDAFGRGALVRRRYTDRYERWDHPIQRDIQRLYSLPLLRTRELDEGLRRIEPWMRDPTVVRRLRRLVFDDLGYPLAWAIEACKRALSDAPEAEFRFDEFHSSDLDLRRKVSRGAFRAGSRELLDRYREAITVVLERAGIGAEQVDDVFLTGGTSQLPFVRALFEERFGAAKLAGADSFTSVGEGLALG